MDTLVEERVGGRNQSAIRYDELSGAMQEERTAYLEIRAGDPNNLGELSNEEFLDY